MFSITFGFVLPGIFRAYGPMAWLVWLFGVNFMWLRGAVSGKLWLRAFGFSICFELSSVDVALGEVQEMPQIKLKETRYSEKDGEKTENIADFDEKKAFNSSEKWTLQMLMKGFKYVIQSISLLDKYDKSFRLPKLQDIEIEIGDKIAFGDEKEWVGYAVIGFRETETDIIYYVEPLQQHEMA